MHVSIIELANFIMDLGPDAKDIDAKIAEKFPDAKFPFGKAGTIRAATEAAANQWRKFKEMKKRNPGVRLLQIRRKPAPIR
jgi:hypothetical protein